jgi:hypothetical protein
MHPFPENFDAHSFFTTLLGDTTPQRREELNKTIDDFGIRFQLDETSPGIEFSADPMTMRINVPRRCLFRLKANAFGYYCAVTELQAKKDGKSDQEAQGRIQRANELLTWAVRTDVATVLGDDDAFSMGTIPANVESLLRGCLKEEAFDIGEDIFKMALAFILHHEIAHLRLEHSAQSPKAEYEADQAAIDWLLRVDGLPLAEAIVRQFGIATGLGWLSALNVYVGPGSGKTHPPAAQRFFTGVEYMTQGLGNNAELPWCTCQMVLLLHAQNAGFPVEPNHMKGSFKEIAKNLLQVIEKAKP